MNTIILYSYTKSPISDYNLLFFIEKEVKYSPNIDYIIIINNYDYNKFIIFPSLQNLKILFRDNIGGDFGAYTFALNNLRRNNKYYNYYFFINSSLVGPMINSENHWSNLFINKINTNVKLVGTTIIKLPTFELKVESDFFMTDNLGLNLLQNEKTIFTYNNNNIDKEFEILNCISKHGYKLNCISDKYIDMTNNFNNTYDYINPNDVIFYKIIIKNQLILKFDIINKFVKSNIHINNFFQNILSNLESSIQLNNSDIIPIIPIDNPISEIIPNNIISCINIKQNKKRNKKLKLNKKVKPKRRLKLNKKIKPNRKMKLFII